MTTVAKQQQINPKLKNMQSCKLAFAYFLEIYKADAEKAMYTCLHGSFGTPGPRIRSLFCPVEVLDPRIYVSRLNGLSRSSSSAANLPDPRLILPNEPTADRLLKLLLPSLKLRDLQDLRGFEELRSRSISFSTLSLITTSLTMLLLQKGQTGTVEQEVVGLGLLWQHKASVHCAHIWWPHSWTSIVQTWSKHMQQRSVSLASDILSSIPESDADGDGRE